MEYKCYLLAIGGYGDFCSSGRFYLVSQFVFCLVSNDTDSYFLRLLSFFDCIDFTVVTVA